MPKFVASTTLSSLDWSTAKVLQGPVTAAVETLKQQDGGPILVVGSRTLVHSLMAARLVDQLKLQICPLLLGSGLRLYPDSSGTTSLTLLSSTALANGVLMQTYEPAAT